MPGDGERVRALVRGRVRFFLALALGLAALSGFVEVADELLEGSLARLDEVILHAVADRRSALLTAAALNVTALGSGIVLTLFTALTALAFHRLGWRRSARLQLLAGAGGAALTTVLKNAFERERPSVVPRLVEVLGYSFPSGHSLASAAVYGTAAVLVGVHARRLADRALVATVAALGLLAIGGSRIYLGVHYPSDVVGGYAAGLAWAFAVLAAGALERRVAGGAGEP